MTDVCRYCCKTLFCTDDQNSPGCRRDFRVKMWGTSSLDDKLVSDLAKAAEATKIGARGLDRLMAGKLSPLNFGLLQQYLPLPDICSAAKSTLFDHLVGSQHETSRHLVVDSPSRL